MRRYLIIIFITVLVGTTFFIIRLFYHNYVYNVTLNKGLSAYSNQEYSIAIESFSVILKSNPNNIDILRLRAISYGRLGMYRQAIADFDKYITIDKDAKYFPFKPENFYVIRSIYHLRSGHIDLATADVERASVMISSASEREELYNNFAWGLATLPEKKSRNGQLAVKYAFKACKLSEWRIPTLLDTLAASYAESSNFPEAISWQQKAIAMCKDEEELTKELKDHLNLYQKGKAYRRTNVANQSM